MSNQTKTSNLNILAPETCAVITVECLSGHMDGRLFVYNKANLVIGRDVKSDLCISSDTQVSRQHARILLENNLIYVKDLDSKNGTLVDGKVISDKTRLTDMSVMTIGSTDFSIVSKNLNAGR